MKTVMILPQLLNSSIPKKSFFWAFRLRFQLCRRAFRYIFARSAYAALAKDAASIPNAVGRILEI